MEDVPLLRRNPVCVRPLLGRCCNATFCSLEWWLRASRFTAHKLRKKKTSIPRYIVWCFAVAAKSPRDWRSDICGPVGWSQAWPALVTQSLSHSRAAVPRCNASGSCGPAGNAPLQTCIVQDMQHTASVVLYFRSCFSVRYRQLSTLMSDPLLSRPTIVNQKKSRKPHLA